jgi:hypothetical protein
MPIDDRTTNRSYKLPNAGNFLADDVARLRDALNAIDADVYARYTKTEVDQLIANLVSGAPGALDTLNELAAAMGNDPNFAATVTNSLAAINTALGNRYTKAESDARYVQGSVQTEQIFTAGINQTAYTLTTGIINKASALVTVDGVVQPTSEYSLSMNGLTLTLSEAPAQGATVRVLALGVASAGAPADDTVTTAKLRDGAVTTAKLASPIAPTVSSINGGPLSGARNRIINGDMRIDQRNAGASVNTNGSYPVDRFRQDFAGGGVITAQRSTTAPAGFTNSVSLTVSTADSSIAAGDYYLLQHRIEGFNTADFGFGAAGAATVTMSFWARSSVTGTYGAALHNDNDTRAYVFTYTINAVNTWEYKTITIAGDTTGTWSTGNTTGISIIFDFGSGTNFNGTAGTWAGSNVFRTSGCVNWIANSGATFYITGVQLEPGTVATLFERIDYSESLRRCQRYYQVLGPSDTLTTGATICVMPVANTGAVNENWGMTEFKVSMRAGPTVSASSWELAGHHGNTPIIAAGTKYALFRYDGSNSRNSGGRLIANNAQASAEL